MWFIVILIIAAVCYFIYKKYGFSFVSGKVTYGGYPEDEVLRIIEGADRGDDDAKSKLGVLFDSGLTSDTHNELRRKIYSPKAVQGDPNAEYWMGFLTNMIDHDAATSLQWYQKSANHGNMEAMRDLSFRYSEFANEPDSGITGFGVNREKELYWQKRAAQLGDQKSQCDMGLDCTLDKKIKESIYWYEMASQGVNPDIRGKAYKALADIYMGDRYPEFKNLERAMSNVKMIFVLRNEVSQMQDDYDRLFIPAVNDYGYMNSRSYRVTNSIENLRNAVYSYSLLSILSESYANNALSNLPYSPSTAELSEWQAHARGMSFMPPFPNASIDY